MTPLQTALSVFNWPLRMSENGDIRDARGFLIAEIIAVGHMEIGTAIADFLNNEMTGKPEFICQKCWLRQNDTFPKPSNF